MVEERKVEKKMNGDQPVKPGLLTRLIVYGLRSVVFLAIYIGMMCMFTWLDGDALTRDVVLNHLRNGVETGVVIFLLVKAARWLRGRMNVK